jgi:tRNA(fMet)-specific endonuclease VapC
LNWFLDTNICINFLRGEYPLIREKLFLKQPSEIKIPVVVEAELRFGVEKSRKKTLNIKMLENFLSPFEIIPFDSQAALKYAVLRTALQKKGTPIGANDMLIAATVLENSGTLVTANTGEFSRVQGLQLENWTVHPI